MHRAKSALLLASLATLVTPQLDAQQDWKKSRAEGKVARQEAREFRQLEVDGDTVAFNVRKLRKGLRWHNTLAGALQSGRNQGKPVVWIQALGDLDGFL